MTNASTINKLRAAFRGLPETGHKQMGLRAVQEAKWLLGKNQERVEELTEKARFHLSYAKEYSRGL